MEVNFIQKKTYVIGICGPSCGGKDTVCNKIIEHIQKIYSVGLKVVILSQDRYYYGGNEDTNYDVPASLNFDRLINDVNKLKECKSIDAPIYDFTKHQPKKETERFEPAPIIIVQGILIFKKDKLRNLFDLKIFVDALKELRFERRMRRDVSERGRNVDEVKKRYFEHVLPSNAIHVEPTKKYSDIILLNNGENAFIGLVVLLDHIEKKIIIHENINKKIEKII